MTQKKLFIHLFTLTLFILNSPNLMLGGLDNDDIDKKYFVNLLFQSCFCNFIDYKMHQSSVGCGSGERRESGSPF